MFADWMAAIARRTLLQAATAIELAQDPLIGRGLDEASRQASATATPKKAAWLVELKRCCGTLTRADFESRPKVRAFIVANASSADEALLQHVGRLNAYTSEGQRPLGMPERTRVFRPLREHPEFAARLERMTAIMTFQEGANCLEYLSPETVAASIARYSTAPAPHQMDAGDARRIARAIARRYPDFFAMVDVADPALVARKMVKNTLPGMPRK